MRRVVVVLALLALPMAAWADTITLINQFGTIAISDMAGTGGLGTIGSSKITSNGSELTTFGTTTAAKGQYLGYVNYSTGALLSGSVAGGGVFSSTGSTFDAIGIGTWAKTLTGSSNVTLFSGSFVGPIDWTLTSKVGPYLAYTLSGDFAGMLWNGRDVTGTTVQKFYAVNGQLVQGTGYISMGRTSLTTPEPGTLGLLGTGLVGIAGMFRRKLLGS